MTVSAIPSGVVRTGVCRPKNAARSSANATHETTWCTSSGLSKPFTLLFFGAKAFEVAPVGMVAMPRLQRSRLVSGGFLAGKFLGHRERGGRVRENFCRGKKVRILPGGTAAPRGAGLGAAGRHPRGGGESRPVGLRVFYCELCSADGSSPCTLHAGQILFMGRFSLVSSSPVYTVRLL